MGMVWQGLGSRVVRPEVKVMENRFDVVEEGVRKGSGVEGRWEGEEGWLW